MTLFYTEDFADIMEYIVNNTGGRTFLDVSHPDYVYIVRTKEGDTQAFALLCDRNRVRIWRIVASVAYGPDVDDLAQESVLKAYLNLKSYRGEASFEAWLCRIAINTAFDYKRSA